ncbi:IS21 family transposase [Desulfopila sp. IMCC35006]|uniref:IS21 family transposase n=1 Tax=Desulfopila sp. IMCC35006 TaxID=2569542 RepID=UPI0010ACB48E|nr:IS21 family transposase [Desulfopila sp. IMCC35006]TKB23745.1 IS21 family transposase [Desulfopila sp. IMCC35006]
MDQYEYIRTAQRVYGTNISELARQTGNSRNTIKKALRGEAWGYSEREQQLFPVLGPYRTIIEEWLKKDKDQPKKQRHTARRVYNRLKTEQGYQGSESNVRRYVRMVQMELGLDIAGQAFIACEPEAGQEAEVDWGTATAVVGGEKVRLKFFCMRSKYSGKHFVRFYPCERQQAFFDAHIQSFSFFGGIFPVLIYDNLTTAVRKILLGKRRIEQESFSKFKAYYSFTARFCNADSGNEKGGVEGLVGFARRNYMVPVPEAESLEELNEKLLADCLSYGSHKMASRSESVADLFEGEKAHLLEQPNIAFSNTRPGDARVDKYATIMVDKNRYSVPWKYAGRRLKTIVHVDRVEIFADGKRLAVHERLFANNKWSLAPEHYLDLIQQRPMSFASARVIRQWREHWPQSLHQLLTNFCHIQGETKGIKDFIAVLMLYSRYQADEVETAVELALEKNLSSSEGVRHLLIYANEQIVPIAQLADWSSLPSPDLSLYGVLGGVQ